MTDRPRKLIEVALPLDEINAACKADKDRKTGTIRNLHKWFAPMPLPAWRALLFAAVIDDPGDDAKRADLLDLIRRLVASGANAPSTEVVEEAQRAIDEHYPDGAPLVMDPFCGGGSTLVEAQRLGMESLGSDLNPVPALIARVLTETLPKVWDLAPLHTGENTSALIATKSAWPGYAGIMRDVLHYSEVVMERVDSRFIAHFPSQPGETPVAWLWARTARCPNPACGVETPLVTSWWLSTKRNDLAWIEPQPENGVIRLRVVANQQTGTAPPSPKTGRGASFTCCQCGGILTEAHLIEAGRQGRLGLRMTAVAVESQGRRTYREPTEADVAAADVPPAEVQDIALPDIPRWFSGPRFGLNSQAAGYTPRQLALLAALSDEVAELPELVKADGGTPEWATAVTSLMALAVGNAAMTWSSQTRWRQRTTAQAKGEGAFARADLPMMWDFAEVYHRSGSVGDWSRTVQGMFRALQYAVPGKGVVALGDARSVAARRPALVATDPPYFDAIGYADLSDYFYLWHRRCLRNVHPDLYVTVATPKAGELTAVPAHHSGNPRTATDYFIDGFTDTFRNLQRSMSPGLPLVVVYASKEQTGGKDETTRWSSILTAMIAAELEITGAWPIHGTGGTRMISQGANAVATYVAMVARPRPAGAPTCSLGEFNRALRRELPDAVHALQAASILPVDMAQAVMGPGMSIFSRYSAVVDQEGRTVNVAEALRLINAVYAEVQEEQEGHLDPDSQFAVAWWHKHGWEAGTFGEADALARPKGISVDDVARAGVIAQQPNKVTAIGQQGLDRGWDPVTDLRPTSWEAVHHLVDRLVDGGGEAEAARLLARVGDAGLADSARLLTYRLASIAAATKRTKDEERYNALIEAWPRLVAQAPQSEGLF